MEKLTSEEKARMAMVTPIAHDDATASCTAEGWKEFLAACRATQGTGPDVPSARFWVARLKADPSKEIHIECKRWVDARAFAHIVAGGHAIEMFEHHAGAIDRWQVKWEGSAMDPHNPLHLVARAITKRSSGSFRPVRTITFPVIELPKPKAEPAAPAP